MYATVSYFTVVSIKKCSITLLLAGDYTTQVVTIATMLNSMEVPLPPSLNDMLKKELEVRLPR